MASYKIAVVNETDQPLKGVTVEAIRLSNLTISKTADTDDSGQAVFTGLTGPHWFRPHARRVSTKVGGRTYTGKVKVQVIAMGESMNVDYVVDSNGMGTHDALFGSSGALAAALTAGGKQTIWLCATHTEPTLSAAYALGDQASSKIVTIWGPPEQRQVLKADATNPGMFSYHKNTDVHLIFINISFDVGSGSGVDLFAEVAGGSGIPGLAMDFANCDFNNVDSIDTTAINAGLAGGEKRFNNCIGSIKSIIVSSQSSGFGGDIYVTDCDISWSATLSDLGNYGGSWTHKYFFNGGYHNVTADMWFQFGLTLEASFKNMIISYVKSGGTLFGQSSSKYIGDFAIFQNLFIISNRVDNRIIYFDSWATSSPNEDAILIDGVFMRASGSAGTPVNAVEIATSDSPDVYLGLIGCAGDWSDCYVGPNSAGSGSSDHGFLNGLGDDDHSHYVLLLGRTAGQVIIGGTAAGDDLRLRSTSHATRGSIYMGNTTRFEFNEVSGKFVLGSNAAILSTTQVALFNAASFVPGAGGSEIVSIQSTLAADGTTGGNSPGLLVEQRIAPTADSAGRFYGLSFTVVHDSGNFDLTGASAMIGMTGFVRQNVAATTIANLSGARATIQPQAGTITEGRVFDARMGVAADAGVITALTYFDVTQTVIPSGGMGTVRGLRIPNLGGSGINTALGITIAAQSGAATTNLGILNNADMVEALTLYFQSDLLTGIRSAESSLRTFHWNDIVMLIDADNSGTGAVFHVMKDAATIAGATSVFLVNEGGQLRLPIGGVNAGVLLGNDVLMYRSAPSVLTIPDTVQMTIVETDLLREFTSGAGVNVEDTLVRDGVFWGEPTPPEIGISPLTTLTLAGNEITDTLRSLAAAGDGRRTPDSSFGIWEATTNLEGNGGFETNTTNWTSPATLARVTTDFKFGAACLQITDGGGDGRAQHSSVITGAPLSVTTYSLSAWFRAGNAAAVGQPFNLQMRTTGGTSGNVDIAQSSSPTTTEWKRFTVIGTIDQADRTGMAIYVGSFTMASGAIFLVDGVQLEEQPIETPYVETDGGTATRSAARVRADTPRMFTESIGWAAFRVRMGFTNTQITTGEAILFNWADASNDLIELRYDLANNQWEVERANLGSGTVLAAAGTFTEGDFRTIIIAWTATNIRISVDGGAFTQSADTNIPTLTAVTADIGSDGSGSHFDGDVMWAMFGSGVLVDIDAEAIDACGRTPPRRSELNPASYPTFQWNATTGVAGPDVLVQHEGLIQFDYEQTRMGFYGVTPTALQTGVAVTIAEVHAALVTLGLITA